MNRYIEQHIRFQKRILGELTHDTAIRANPVFVVFPRLRSQN